MPKDEIPDLLKRLNQLRTAVPKDSRITRFRLEEVPAANSAPEVR